MSTATNICLLLNTNLQLFCLYITVSNDMSTTINTTRKCDVSTNQELFKNNQNQPGLSQNNGIKVPRSIEHNSTLLDHRYPSVYIKSFNSRLIAGMSSSSSDNQKLKSLFFRREVSQRYETSGLERTHNLEVEATRVVVVLAMKEQHHAPDPDAQCIEEPQRRNEGQ